MNDIAQKTGVSRTAVSLVLNEQYSDKIRIPETTRQRILDTALEMGYRTNQLAKAVASGNRMRMLGYLVAAPKYEPYWNTIAAALEEAEKAGYSMKVFSSTRGTLAEQVRQCIELRLGGLIIRVDGDKSAALEEAKNAQMPVVIVDEGMSAPYGTLVAADDTPGCRLALDHLVGLGHQRIAFISSGFPSHNNEIDDIGSTREQLFREQMALRHLEIPEGYIVHDVTMVYVLEEDEVIDDSSVRKAVQSLLNHPQGRPTAIFCWRDETAIFALSECRRHNLRVPEDISIVGFSNIGAALLVDPPLSTVKSPWSAMGKMAVQQLIQTPDGGALAAPAYLVPSGFVARRSSGPAPDNL